MGRIDLSDVQGNILKGFDKPNLRLLFFKFGHDEIQIKKWLGELAEREIIPSTTRLKDASEVQHYRKLKDPEYRPQEIWLHISLSSSGIRKLHLPIPPSTGIYEINGNRTTGYETTVKKYDPNLTQPFTEGMKERSLILGDTDVNAATNWVEPFKDWNDPLKNTEIDALFIVASDEENDGDSYTLRLIEEATLRGIICAGLQRGKSLENEAGKQVEHFGFRDGISQPLIKGIDDVEINKRKIYNDVFEPEDFVLFGLESDLEWANNGSFLVFRRLYQDVTAFWEFMQGECEKLNLMPEELAAKFFGRWKSGAPLSKYPKNDPAGINDSEYNDFVYCSNLEQTSTFRDPALEIDDPRGKRTPRFAHIRKANPRDDGRRETLEENYTENRKHRILRRGIPYGIPWADDPKSDRGLLFICYQRDLEEQFEYIQNLWANKSDFPLPDAVKVGVVTDRTQHGPDPISGQHSGEDPVNLLLTENGKQSFKPITLKQWVTTTGGEYFFSPSIYALKNLQKYSKLKNTE